MISVMSRMRRSANVLLAAGSALLVAACQAPSVPVYQQPAASPPEGVATISGSMRERGFTLPNDRTFIRSVDGRMSGFGKNDYDKSLLVTQGNHAVEIGFNRAAAWGNIAVQVELEAGKVYVARCNGGTFRAACWIEEAATKAHVTDKLIVRLDDGSGMSQLFFGK